MHSETIADRLSATDQRPSGFDYLRLALSLSILIWHSFYICYGTKAAIFAKEGPTSPLINFLVPSFFALSGFLVTGSLMRVKKLSVFLTLRVLRIIPALATEIVISALLIGSLTTTMPLSEYFSDARFFSYFLNIIGEIHFYLPGVFNDNPTTTVNQQLWTIPYELFSYGCLTLLAMLGLVYRRGFFAILTLLFTLWCYNQDIHNLGALMIVCCFLWGSVLYLFREKIPLNIGLFILAFIIYIGVMSVHIQYIGYLTTVPVAYMTVYLGTLNPPRKEPIISGDYSYGLYLYSFPIQQALYLLTPYCREWYGNLAVSLVVVGLCAYLSWNFIELKILDRRNEIIASVNSTFDRISVLTKRPRV